MGLGTLVSKIASLGKPVPPVGEVSSELKSSALESVTAEAHRPSTPAASANALAPDGPIHADMTMGDLIAKFPSAQRALFQKYHVGGCSSCGYDESETLKDVMANHGVTDMQEVIRFVLDSEQGETRMRITAPEVAEMLKQGSSFKLVDVRDDYERRLASIPGSVLLTRELATEIMESWPKDTPIVFHCHHGMRSMDAASYFMGHGFTNVKNMEGGIDAWSLQVDPSVRRY